MKVGKVLTAGLLGMAPLAAMASQASGTFAVGTTVLSVCTVVASPLTFINYDPTASGNTDGTTTIGVLCTNGTSYTVRLSQGANGTGVTARKMLLTGGSDLLPYSLYRDSSRSQNWGVTDGSDTASGTGNGLLQNVTVYGRIGSGSTASAGIYLDTINVTVNY
ncbi:MAG TPA: spore coat U domain-containing protein [Nevskiaceae bacterium]|nr:spore coat U domain-containing protein [Nevskiaceae bacterium]